MSRPNPNKHPSDESYFKDKWWQHGNDGHQQRAPIASTDDPETPLINGGDQGNVLNTLPGMDGTTGIHPGFLPKTPVEKVRNLLKSTSDTNIEENEVLYKDLLRRLEEHSLFCQLDVLCKTDSDQYGWKESFRWVKYEEKLDEADRWSKPHVPTLSLNALFAVRKAIYEDTAAILLDVEAKEGCLHHLTGLCENCFSFDKSGKLIDKTVSCKKIHKSGEIPKTAQQTVAEVIAETLVKERRIKEDSAKKFLEVLMKPHKHQHRKGKKGGNLAVMNEDEDDINSNNHNYNNNITYPHSYPKGVNPDCLKDHKPNKRLMRKIVKGAEVANILVGQVDFLDNVLICFARLDQSAVLADLTEVSLPTRFIIVILAPANSEKPLYQYEEMGRAFAILLSDKVFCEVSYCAQSRQDLLAGMDEYIDDVTVLPPCLWDPSIRLEPPDQTVSMEKIRRRLMDSSRQIPPPEAYHFAESAVEDPTLKRTGRLFGGLVDDIKRRYPMYWSDIRDGFSLQCFATIIFLYFACITPIVTFGGLLGIATDNYQGTMETLVSGCVCGVLYALFAGQPLSIVGATGPLLVFESILYQICNGNNINYLPFRFWVGMWVFLFLMLLVAFDLSALVVYITRFTEESFSVLISLIFLYEAFMKCLHIADEYPVHRGTVREHDHYTCHCEELNMTSVNSSMFDGSTVDYEETTGAISNSSRVHTDAFSGNFTAQFSENCITHLGRIIVAHDCVSAEACEAQYGWRLTGAACHTEGVTDGVPDVFFFSCFLFVGTFFIALSIKDFKNSSFFPTIMRSTVSDFAVFTAIMLCTGLDIFVGIDTPKLLVPDEFVTTRSDRNWVVDVFALRPFWLGIVAFVPAALATILIFLDQQITAVIVNRKEHKLKKGHGYHLDCFVLAFSIAICSLLGLPWFVAATVRAITHVRSLIVESDVRAPGEKVQMLGVREQRFTGVCIHVLIGLSVLATGILKFVPMPVLYGVFLYMGFTSLRGVQFIDRIVIMFMPVKYQPDRIYLRHVPTKRVHIFTIVQILCMVGMWAVKSIKMIALLFPLLLLALCIVRKVMECYFTNAELFWLDHLLPERTRRAKEDKEKELTEPVTVIRKISMQVPQLEGPWDETMGMREIGHKPLERHRKLSEGIIMRSSMDRIALPIPQIDE